MVERPQEPPALRVPDAGSAVPAGRYDQLSARAEDDTDAIGVAREGGEGLPAARVDDSDFALTGSAATRAR